MTNELSIINNKLAIDSQNIALITEPRKSQKKMFIVYSDYEYEKWGGDNLAKIPVYDFLVPQDDIYLADSRFSAEIANLEHTILLEVIAEYCDCEEMRDSNFIMVESNLMYILVAFAIAKKNHPQRQSRGFVYIFQDKLNNQVKLGRTKNVTKRFSQIKGYNPNLKIYGFFEVNNDVEAEKHLHDCFSEKRIKNTEMFNISAEDAFQELKNMQPDFNFQDSTPVCVDASIAVANALTHRKQQLLA